MTGDGSWLACREFSNKFIIAHTLTLDLLRTAHPVEHKTTCRLYQRWYNELGLREVVRLSSLGMGSRGQPWAFSCVTVLSLYQGKLPTATP